MAATAEAVEAALIDSVCGSLAGRVAADLMGQCEAFVRQFYHWVPAEDLAGRSADGLGAAAIAVWELARDRLPGAASVRAYNPVSEEDGWRSASTVVEAVTDDMPFLVDSVAMELSRQGYGIRLAIVPVIDVLRDANGRLTDVLAPGSGVRGAVTESMMRFEIDREPAAARLEALAAGIRGVLADVRAAVEDWPAMRQRLHEIVAGFESSPPPVDHSKVEQACAFLEWVDDGNFILLGYREYDLVGEAGEEVLRTVGGSGLGILRRGTAPPSASFARLPAEVRSLARAADLLILTKANSRSTVHRPLYLDYIGVKRFEAGKVCGERRFLGLYTTAAERANPREIPILRGKVERVMRRAAFPPGGHHAKALARVLESYPRDELFQIADEELFEIAMGIVALGERRRVRLFTRADPYRRFVSCLVFVPRERYNTENRERIASVLRDAFAASELDWDVRVSDSKLARIHYVLRTSGAETAHDVAEIERQIARVTRPWTGHLADALRDVHGDEEGEALFRRYRGAFPTAYQADWRARAAVADVDRAEALADGKHLIVSVYRSDDEERSTLRCKLLSSGERLALSDLLPIFENMGLRVGDERPYELTPEGRAPIWMYDIGVTGAFDVDLRAEATRACFQDAFTGAWLGDFENDRLGALVLGAALTGREVSLLRALVNYLRQAGSTFSDRYMQQALTGNPSVARLLVELFGARLDPDRHGADRHNAAQADRLVGEIEQAIEAIASGDQRRIIGDCLAMIRATVRTNYYQRDPDGQPRPVLSLKLEPSLMPFLRPPRPRFETFVYSPHMKGVYVRGGKVARGGIRISDRREDFRSEALERMAVQAVRNAAIVPAGAHGALAVKHAPSTGRHGAPLQEEAECYRLFVCGLLDVTDNIVAGQVVSPPAVARFDEEDPYLVIGREATAELAELASDEAAAHGFWLADSFATAEPHGRGDRRAGITARGAWESVARHVRDLGLAPHSDPITAVGIGGVSGDTSGPGMLLPPNVKLVGAFDAQHVFLDPHPDPEASFAERRRLLDLPGSCWRDYDLAAVSQGGGVFERAAGPISLSAQMREALTVDADALTADELIRAMLRAPVDLLWNGGAGTFVKASSESNAELGDRANDAVRVDAAELRCRVVGEASSGGFTQQARIQYAAAGGRINTDAIDTVAQANSSDQEVNLRILLDAAVAHGEITTPQRDQLLDAATDAVADRSLGESYAQALALSLERRQAADLLDLHARLIDVLRGSPDDTLKDLPSQERIQQLHATHQGLTGPELAVLLAHAKIVLKTRFLESDLPEDTYLRDRLADSPAASLPERLRPRMRQHRLAREIIASDLANSIVDYQGTTFVSRLAEETRATPADIARAYTAAMAVFEMRGFWREVQALDDKVDEETQSSMLLQGRRLITRAARWLVQNRRPPLEIAAVVSDYAAGAETLREALPNLLSSLDGESWHARMLQFAGARIPTGLSLRVAAMDAMFFALDVIDSARGTGRPVERAAEIHFALDRRLELAWLRDRIFALPRVDRWQTLARSGLREELYGNHRALTAAVLEASPPSTDAGEAIDQWAGARDANIRRYLATLRDIRAAQASEFTTLLVAVRELAHLTLAPAASASTTAARSGCCPTPTPPTATCPSAPPGPGAEPQRWREPRRRKGG
jgi:glutamate dehydrogenase